MKPKNMPERVTIRRAMAYNRKHGTMPANFDADLIYRRDTKIRLGASKRLRVALKFQ